MSRSTWKKDPDCTFCNNAGEHYLGNALCPCGKRVPLPPALPASQDAKGGA